MRALLLLVIMFFYSPTASASERGLEIAREKCARCHAIDPARPWDSIGSTPSFMLMAKKLDRYEERIMSVAGRLPHIGQKLEPSHDELEAILDYVKSLVE